MTQAQELMRIVGREKMQEICDAFGGERVYIPTSVPDPERDERIMEIFIDTLRGGSTVMSSYRRAAETSGLSVRRVQEIIATH